MKKVIFATTNKNKVREVNMMMKDFDVELQTMGEAGINIDIVEDGTTFEENARIKARAVYDITHTAVLADDSGLIVDALDGAPGVYSSRYSGIEGDDEANNAKLLEEMRNVPENERTARFACVLVFIDDDGTETVAEGFMEGRIGHEEKGAEGFGYDPLFWPEYFDYSCTLAEVSQSEKNKISHRGNALRELKKYLSNS